MIPSQSLSPLLLSPGPSPAASGHAGCQISDMYVICFPEWHFQSAVPGFTELKLLLCAAPLPSPQAEAETKLLPSDRAVFIPTVLISSRGKRPAVLYHPVLRSICTAV